MDPESPSLPPSAACSRKQGKAGRVEHHLGLDEVGPGGHLAAEQGQLGLAVGTEGVGDAAEGQVLGAAQSLASASSLVVV